MVGNHGGMIRDFEIDCFNVLRTLIGLGEVFKRVILLKI
jgi:hypothetical protein